jgi:hypothetical protein
MNDRDSSFIKSSIAEQSKDPILDAIELLNFTITIISDCPTCSEKARAKKT